MFDDPKKQLKWMEAELLAAEAPKELPEEDDLMQRVDALINDEPVYHPNPALDFSRMVYADETYDAESADRAGKTRAGKAVKTAQAVPQKNSKIKGLVFLAVLETLGILAIIGWWIQWLT